MPSNERRVERQSCLASEDAPLRPRRGRRLKPVVEHPEPLTREWVEPHSFPASLALHAARYGDSLWHLHRAVVREDEPLDRKTIQDWAAGRKSPNTMLSLTILDRIERRYRLPSGYFRDRLPTSGRAVRGRALTGISSVERRRLAWHLPDDFDSRPEQERAEIVGGDGDRERGEPGRVIAVRDQRHDGGGREEEEDAEQEQRGERGGLDDHAHAPRPATSSIFRPEPSSTTRPIASSSVLDGRSAAGGIPWNGMPAPEPVMV